MSRSRGRTRRKKRLRCRRWRERSGASKKRGGTPSLSRCCRRGVRRCFRGPRTLRSPHSLSFVFFLPPPPQPPCLLLTWHVHVRKYQIEGGALRTKVAERGVAAGAGGDCALGQREREPSEKVKRQGVRGANFSAARSEPQSTETERDAKNEKIDISIEQPFPVAFFLLFPNVP